MTSQVATSESAGVWKGVYIVRGPDGNVKYDDPHNVPQVILDCLSETDLAHLEQLKNQEK